MESRNGWPQPLIPVMLSPTGWVAPMDSRCPRGDDNVIVRRLDQSYRGH
jgi:hypothetical protein